MTPLPIFCGLCQETKPHLFFAINPSGALVYVCPRCGGRVLLAPQAVLTDAARRFRAILEAARILRVFYLNLDYLPA